MIDTYCTNRISRIHKMQISILNKGGASIRDLGGKIEEKKLKGQNFKKIKNKKLGVKFIYFLFFILGKTLGLGGPSPPPLPLVAPPLLLDICVIFFTIYIHVVIVVIKCSYYPLSTNR